MAGPLLHGAAVGWAGGQRGEGRELGGRAAGVPRAGQVGWAGRAGSLEFERERNTKKGGKKEISGKCGQQNSCAVAFLIWLPREILGV